MKAFFEKAKQTNAAESLTRDGDLARRFRLALRVDSDARVGARVLVGRVFERQRSHAVVKRDADALFGHQDL